MSSIRPRFIRSSVVCMGCAVLFVYSRSGLTQNAEALSRIKELQKQRVSVQEDLHEVLNRRYSSDPFDYEVVISAERDLLTARLAVAANRTERTKACDDAVEDVKAILEIQEKLFEAARFNRDCVFATKSYLLETQIARQKAETIQHD